MKLRIEVPVEDMARLSEMEEIPSGPASQMPRRVSIWNAIHPRLLELIRERNSTILFVNSRQVAERLAGALNELAGEPIARAHHGSLAAAQRSVIEEQLKAGQIRALCATSTLELGIDMGAVDLVIQIEAPPSVASGMQRIGRAGHHRRRRQRGHPLSQVPRRPGGLRRRHARHARGPHRVHALSAQPARRAGAATGRHRCASTQCQGLGGRRPRGKDACEDPTAHFVCRKGAETANRNPIETQSPKSASTPSTILFAAPRPLAASRRSAFEGVLDLLSGRYPSDEFAELRPRLTWDRIRNVVTARDGAARLAILNAGTIPDRGLYGVFLALHRRQSRARRRAR